MARVVISEFMDEAAVERLRAATDVVFDPGLADDRTALAAALADADALVVRNRTQVDDELLAAAPALVVVGRLGVGLDNIDTGACELRGVAVRTAAGANAVSVAEYVVGAMFVLLRGVYGETGRVVAGEWPRTGSVGREVAGKRLGLVGLGSIARAVADRALALGMHVSAHDPYVTTPPRGISLRGLDEVLETADAVSVHVPLTPDTTGLLGRTRIERMKEGAVVVDTSRGGVVDHDAVVDALRSGRLGGAALDVFPTEPVDADAGARYRDVPNLVLTPHIAGITVESNRRVGSMVAEAVLRELEEHHR